VKCLSRIDFVRQKKIEAELLTLLQLSHEESLKTSEEHQRTIRTYEHMLNSNQRRVEELTQSEQPVTQVHDVTPVVIVQPRQEETSVTVNETIQTSYEKLIERATQLSNEMRLIIDYYGGSW